MAKQALTTQPLAASPLVGSMFSVIFTQILAQALAWLKDYLFPPATRVKGALPDSIPVAISESDDLDWLRSYLNKTVTEYERRNEPHGAPLIGSQLSVLIDFLIEKIKGWLSGVDWHHATLQIELQAINGILASVIPALEAQGGMVALFASIVKPMLLAEKARVEALLNQAPA